MNKPTWLKDAVAKADGYYSKKGEKLKGISLTPAQIAEWNGVKAKPAPEPKVEEVVAVADSIDVDGNGMLSREEAEDAVASKKSIFTSAFGR